MQIKKLWSDTQYTTVQKFGIFWGEEINTFIKMHSIDEKCL